MSPFDPRRHHRRSIRLRGFDYSTACSYFITLCCQDRIHRFGRIENHKMILNDLGDLAQEEWLKLPDRFPLASLGPFQIMPDHIHFILTLLDNPAETSDPENLVGAPLAGAPMEAPAENQKDLFLLGQPLRLPQQEKTQGILLLGQPQGLPQQENPQEGPEENRSDSKGRPLRSPLRVAIEPSPKDLPSLGKPQGLPQRIGLPEIIGAYKSLVFNRCLEIFKSKNEIMGKLWQRNYYEHIIRDRAAYRSIAKYIYQNPVKWQENAKRTHDHYPGEHLH